MAAANELQGEGEAPATADDAFGWARRRAVASVAEQVQVEVRSSFKATESYGQVKGSDSLSLELTSQIDTRTSAVLEGVEVKETCSEDGSVRVRVALNRAQFARAGEQRLEVLSAELREEIASASHAEVAHALLEAIAIWSRAAERAAAAEALARAVRIVGKRETEVAVPTAASLDARARSALARAVFRLEVQAPLGAEVIAQAATACLAAAGMPVSASAGALSADATVSLQVVLDPPLKVADALYVARGSLTAALRRPGGNAAVAAAERHGKGGGADGEAAQREAVRRLLAESLPGALDEALQSLHWSWLKPCAAGPR